MSRITHQKLERQCENVFLMEKIIRVKLQTFQQTGTILLSQWS